MEPERFDPLGHPARHPRLDLRDLFRGDALMAKFRPYYCPGCGVQMTREPRPHLDRGLLAVAVSRWEVNTRPDMDDTGMRPPGPDLRGVPEYVHLCSETMRRRTSCARCAHRPRFHSGGRCYG